METGTTEGKLRGYLKRVTVELSQTRQRLHDMRAAGSEPIAIVGMACRLPGDIDSPDGLWDLVASGRDAVGPFPADRGWDPEVFHPDPDHRGTSYVRDAAMLSDVASFDPAFFGINPREALSMDPQQRLMLEISWEAFERASIDIREHAGARVGVYTGIVASDYVSRLTEIPQDVEGYVTTGTIPSVASGRVSYTFGFEGPAVSVDTACSSSLTALHLAIRALRANECEMALAGGVSVASSPLAFVDFSRQRGLSPDGRIKAFAAAADGTNWAEGAGVVLVERLSDARRHGHAVLAVIRGSAINQDGASNGLSAPNDRAQQRVIAAALVDSGLSTADIDVVEAHGTGTPLGDPIEAKALLATYGQGHTTDHPLWLGSVKSNLGHSAAAAGVTSVIKTVMALRHKVMPKTLNVDEPTPNVDWSAGAVKLLTEQRDWPDLDRARRAGVSSFGVSGTNAHLILEEAPPDPDQDGRWPSLESRGPECCPATGAVPLVVSGRSLDALRSNAGRLANHMRDHSGQTLEDLGFSLTTSRPVWEHRGVVVAANREGALSGLSCLTSGAPNPSIVSGIGDVRGHTALIFPGQGAQWSGMAVELAKNFPVFAESLEDCVEALRPVTDWNLWTELHGELDRLDIVQPALWAVMVSLARLWESFGVEPSAVAGHSQGEIAAAVVAGALSLKDGARVVALRSTVIAKHLAGHGGMASIELPRDDARDLIEPYGERISVATLNGPTTTVVSGEADAIGDLVTKCESKSIRARRIPVDYASHSAQVEIIRDEVLETLSGITPRESRIPMYSTVTGSRIRGEELDAAYWYRNLREPIRFNEVVGSLLADGHRFFVESSAHPVLTMGLQEIFEAEEVKAVAVGSLRREDGGADRFLTSVAQGFVRGLPGVDWQVAVAAGGAKAVELPTYAFQRQRLWLEQDSAVGDIAAAGVDAAEHGLLGAAVAVGGADQLLLTGRLSLRTHPWLRDHAVSGTVLLPGTGFVECVLHAGGLLGCDRIDELVLRTPLRVPDSGDVQVQVLVREPESGTDNVIRPVEVYSRTGDAELSDPWTCHAVGTVTSARRDGSDAVPGLDVWPPMGGQPLAVDDFYERLNGLGYQYGPRFQSLRSAWALDGDVYAEVGLSEDMAKLVGRFSVHPALFDGALHTAVLSRLSQDRSGTAMPFEWSGVELHAIGATAARIRLTPNESGSVTIRVADQEGRPVASVESLSFGEAAMGPGMSAPPLYRIEWVPVTAPTDVGVDWYPLGGEALDLTALPDDVGELIVVPVGGTDVYREVARAQRVIQWSLTRGGAAEPSLIFTAATDGPVETAVAGFVRAAQREHPGRFGLLYTAGPVRDQDVWIAAGLLGEEPEVRIVDGVVTAPRLARVDPPAADKGDDVAAGCGERTVLVTGGTGSLGAKLSRHLVTGHGVRRLLLTGRQGPNAPGAAELAADLETLGAHVDVVACDVGDRESLRALLAGVSDDHPLGGVVHLAGEVDDTVIESLSDEQIRRVFHGKAEGAAQLDSLTASTDLDFFVLFSSAAGVLGAAGRAGYAAANSYLDGIARDRVRRGRPGVSLAWGRWSQADATTGHADRQGPSEPAIEGFVPVSDEEGLALFDAAMRVRDDEPVYVTGRINAGALRDGIAQVPPILRALAAPPRKRVAAAANSVDVTRLLDGKSEKERQETLREIVCAHAAAILQLKSPSDFDPETTFREAGFESLTTVELRNQLSSAVGTRLPNTVLFDHPTPAALARHLASTLSGDAAPDATAGSAPASEDGLGALILKAFEQGELARVQEISVGMAAFRDRYTLPGPGNKPHVTPFHKGGDGPLLICVPSFTWFYNPYYYARFADGFQGLRPVMMVDLPGFRDGDALPETMDSAARALEDAVIEATDGREFVLLGHSAGAFIAKAAAARLEAGGRPPEALVVLDPPVWDTSKGLIPQWSRTIFGSLVAQTRENGNTADSDAWITARAHYTALDYDIPNANAPTLLVRAEDLLKGLEPENDGWTVDWPTRHDTAHTLGDHFSMINDHGPECAQVVENWLRELPDAKD